MSDREFQYSATFVSRKCSQLPDVKVKCAINECEIAGGCGALEQTAAAALLAVTRRVVAEHRMRSSGIGNRILKMEESVAPEAESGNET